MSLLNLLRGGAPVGPDPETSLAQFYLAMYWGLFFHHYWLDQKIWKPSRDVQLTGGIRFAMKQSTHPTAQMYAQYINPSFVKLLGTLGFGRVYANGRKGFGCGMWKDAVIWIV